MASLSSSIDLSIAVSLASTPVSTTSSASSVRRYLTLDGIPASFHALSHMVEEPVSKRATTSPGPPWKALMPSSPFTKLSLRGCVNGCGNMGAW